MNTIKSIFRLILNGFKAVWNFITQIFKFMGAFLAWLANHFEYIIAVTLLAAVMYFLYQISKGIQGQNS